MSTAFEGASWEVSTYETAALADADAAAAAAAYVELVYLRTIF